jgi:hypothetical protein
MSFEDASKPTTRHIVIPGDVLLPDPEFCVEVLDGATRRTARRLEAQGLPFVMVRGRKYRPLNEGRAWLAARIQRRNSTPQRPRRA